VVTSIDDLDPQYRITATDALARVDALEKAGNLRDLGPTSGNGGGEADAIPFLPEHCTWTIGGTEYELRSPVIKQEKQILELARESQKKLGPVKIDGADIKKSAKKAAEAVFSIDSLVTVLGDGISQFFAIILTPKDMAVKEKNLAEIAEHLECEMSLTQQAEVLQDFFGYVRHAGALLAPQIESMTASIVKAVKRSLSQ
jgi:hypothetical protein